MEADLQAACRGDSTPACVPSGHSVIHQPCAAQRSAQQDSLGQMPPPPAPRWVSETPLPVLLKSL